MTVQWTRRAKMQIEEIAAYIACDSVEAADRMVNRIEAAVANLAKFPLMGRAGRVKHSRELVIARTAYVVPYRITGDLIEILSVFHGNQSFPEEF